VRENLICNRWRTSPRNEKDRPARTATRPSGCGLGRVGSRYANLVAPRLAEATLPSCGPEVVPSRHSRIRRSRRGPVGLDQERSERRGRAERAVGARHPVSAACWDRVAEGLALSYDVVCYDARGHGASDRATSYPVELHVAHLIGLAQALRLDRPVLIGHSMGGVHAAWPLHSWTAGPGCGGPALA
jgi:hypothetical protein